MKRMTPQDVCEHISGELGFLDASEDWFAGFIEAQMTSMKR
jgi:hypothetical protein